MPYLVRDLSDDKPSATGTLLAIYVVITVIFGCTCGILRSSAPSGTRRTGASVAASVLQVRSFFFQESAYGWLTSPHPTNSYYNREACLITVTGDHTK